MDALYLLWWVQERDMSPVVVAAILAAGDLALMLFEVPTGWFADRFGNRRSLILGSLVQVAGMLCCWLGEGIPGLVAASLLVALGDAFRSGADQALLYRTCAVLGREDEFQRIEARASAVSIIALVCLILVGGAIVTTWGFAAGWLAEAALCAIGGGIACAMREPPALASRGERTAVDPTPLAIPWRLMALLIVPAACLDATAGAVAFLARSAGETEVGTMTVLVAILALAEAAGAIVAMRLPASGPTFQIALGALGIAGTVAALAVPAAVVPLALALALALGTALPLRAAAIQRLAHDDVRARVASLASACDMALTTMLVPFAAYWGT